MNSRRNCWSCAAAASCSHIFCSWASLFSIAFRSISASCLACAICSWLSCSWKRFSIASCFFSALSVISRTASVTAAVICIRMSVSSVRSDEFAELLV